MEQYIKKSALVAEIERRLKFIEIRLKRNNSYTEEGNTAWKRDKALYDAHNFLLSFLNALEVKEMDLEKELIKWHKEHFKKDGTFIGMSGFYLTNNSQMDIAKHFFELGLNASNPLTWEDMRLIAEIGEEFMNSKDSDSFDEEGYYKEILKRFKAQKGE